MSSIFDSALSTSEVLEVLSERNFLTAMLRFEASLARAQAAVGLIPEAAAQSIIGTCKIDLFDVTRIVRDSARSGSIATPLVNSLKETVGLFNKEAAAYVHFGCCAQDVVDTALALVTQDALALMEADSDKAITMLLELAERHAADPMLARTLMQPTSVTSFGLKCAGWAGSLLRSRERMLLRARNALSVQLGSALGASAQMKDSGGRVLDLMAVDLSLRVPQFCWHTQRDEWVALGSELGLLAGSLGKMAKDLSLMGQFEVHELSDAQGRQTLACMVAIAAAQRAPQRVASLLSSMLQEHEGALGAWQAELAEWSGLLASVHGSSRAMAQILPILQVDAQRMRSNLDTFKTTLPSGNGYEGFHADRVKQAAGLVRAQLVVLSARQRAIAQGVYVAKAGSANK